MRRLGMKTPSGPRDVTEQGAIPLHRPGKGQVPGQSGDLHQPYLTASQSCSLRDTTGLGWPPGMKTSSSLCHNHGLIVFERMVLKYPVKNPPAATDDPTKE